MKKSIAVILSSAVICLLLQSPAFGSYNLQTPQEETSALQSGLSDLTFGPQIKPVLFVKDAEGYCIAPLEGRINYESISRFLSRQEEAFPIDPISKPKLCPPQTMETALDLMTQGKALNQFVAGPAVMIPLTGLYLGFCAAANHLTNTREPIGSYKVSLDEGILRVFLAGGCFPIYTGLI